MALPPKNFMKSYQIKNCGYDCFRGKLSQLSFNLEIDETIRKDFELWLKKGLREYGKKVKKNCFLWCVTEYFNFSREEDVLDYIKQHLKRVGLDVETRYDMESLSHELVVTNAKSLRTFKIWISKFSYFQDERKLQNLIEIIKNGLI